MDASDRQMSKDAAYALLARNTQRLNASVTELAGRFDQVGNRIPIQLAALTLTTSRNLTCKSTKSMPIPLGHYLSVLASKPCTPDVYRPQAAAIQQPPFVLGLLLRVECCRSTPNPSIRNCRCPKRKRHRALCRLHRWHHLSVYDLPPPR